MTINKSSAIHIITQSILSPKITPFNINRFHSSILCNLCLVNFVQNLPNKGGIGYTHLVYSISIPPLKLKYFHSTTPITLQNFKLVTVASHNDANQEANQECIHCHDECPSFPQSLNFRPSHRTSTSCDCCFHTSQGSTSTCTRQHLLLETLAFTGL